MFAFTNMNTGERHIIPASSSSVGVSEKRWREEAFSKAFDEMYDRMKWAADEIDSYGVDFGPLGFGYKGGRDSLEVNFDPFFGGPRFSIEQKIIRSPDDKIIGLEHSAFGAGFDASFLEFGFNTNGVFQFGINFGGTVTWEFDTLEQLEQLVSFMGTEGLVQTAKMVDAAFDALLAAEQTLGDLSSHLLRLQEFRGVLEGRIEATNVTSTDAAIVLDNLPLLPVTAAITDASYINSHLRWVDGVPYLVDSTGARTHYLAERSSGISKFAPIGSDFDENAYKEKLSTQFKKIAYCFGAGTLVETPSGQREIAGLKVGDTVLAYNEHLLGRGPLVPRRVTHVHTSTDQRVVKFHGTSVTPGHHFLTVGGDFEPLRQILDSDGIVVGLQSTPVRATTGHPVDSLDDLVTSLLREDGGRLRLVSVRSGYVAYSRGNLGYTLAAIMREQGFLLNSNGIFVGPDGKVALPVERKGRPLAIMLVQSEIT